MLTRWCSLAVLALAVTACTSEDTRAWRDAQSAASASSFRDFVRRFPDSSYTEPAKREMERLSREVGQALLLTTATGPAEKAEKLALTALADFEPMVPAELAFAVSVQAYLSENNDLLERMRRSAFPSGESSQSIRDWVPKIAADASVPSHLASFISALAAAASDKPGAIELLRRSIETATNEQWKARYRDTLTALDDATSHISMGITSDDPLVYSGEMREFNGGWLPVEGKFQVQGGSMVSFFGGQSTSRKQAHFGGWKFARAPGSNSIIGWAATFVRGDLYIEAAPARLVTEGPNLVEIHVESAYRVIPVDYWGKFKLVRLDPASGHSYPMLTVPFYKSDDGTEISSSVLGTTFRANPKHFTQGGGPVRFFGGSALGKDVQRASQYGRVYQFGWF